MTLNGYLNTSALVSWGTALGSWFHSRGSFPTKCSRAALIALFRKGESPFSPAAQEKKCFTTSKDHSLNHKGPTQNPNWDCKPSVPPEVETKSPNSALSEIET